MKRFLGLIIILLLNSCDDGDMQFTSFNFGTAPIKECTLNNLIYKINGKEALIISIPKEVFDNIEGTKTLSIGNSNTGQIDVIYRLFSGDISDNTLCSVIPPADPVVTDEWIAAEGGIIEIITKAIPSAPDSTTGNTTIEKYTNTIIFQNIVFKKGSEQLVIATYPFGNYETNTDN